jgi:hypothetical protein
MDITVNTIEYKDKRSLGTELLFIIACEKVKGSELVNVRLANVESAATFRNSAAAILRKLKRDGVISLFVFEDEIASSDKTECIYLLNKFPSLAEMEASEMGIYIKL